MCLAEFSGLRERAAKLSADPKIIGLKPGGCAKFFDRLMRTPGLAARHAKKFPRVHIVGTALRHLGQMMIGFVRFMHTVEVNPAECLADVEIFRVELDGFFQKRSDFLKILWRGRLL